MSVIQISAIELQKKSQENFKPVLLDVREDHEFDFAHIEGSQHIPNGYGYSKNGGLKYHG